MQDINKHTNEKNRNRLIISENKLVVVRRGFVKGSRDTNFQF